MEAKSKNLVYLATGNSCNEKLSDIDYDDQFANRRYQKSYCKSEKVPQKTQKN
jgi:hypothetical protein